MRSRFLILIIAIVVALIALALWHGKTKLAGTPSAISPATNVAPPTVDVTSSLASAPVHSNTSLVAQAIPSTSASSLPTESKEQQMREQLANFNDVDIEFYGRLEDQFGAAVGNVQIRFEVPFNNGHTVGVNRGTIMADGNGFFTVSGYKGKSLSVVPMKAGYALASLNGGGIYSYLWPESQRAHPDRNNPTIIKMWKLQGAEPLANFDQTYKLHYTRESLNFDLAAGKMVAVGGDVRITVNRPTGEVSEHNPQKWSVDFGVADGGFLETSSKESKVTFAAPEGDYQTTGTFENNNGTDGLDKFFFVKSRNGQVFSKFYFSLGINNKPDGLMYITFRGVANTNGSRNWEATAPKDQ